MRSLALLAILLPFVSAAYADTINPDTTFTVRDCLTVACMDDFDDTPFDGGYWGFITNSTGWIDKTFAEFDLSAVQGAPTVFLDFGIITTNNSANVYLGTYDANGLAEWSDFNSPLTNITSYSLPVGSFIEVSLDVTSQIAAASGSHIGFAFTGDPLQAFLAYPDPDWYPDNVYLGDPYIPVLRTPGIIPEPTSLLLFGTGLSVLALAAYRRRRK